ncbi:hypothetical protein [Shouchella lonarensis]|uniref:Uncharacterized protein n=1 Tax=Shouchella lonarensis TaxID=1464122 RepID=A0A1G6HPS2_9BACI|nr:hypothetical protein [Shouchella lonarensis]SDB95496.1 hypothetical protein SAMN05421737_10481 [Shouchella lonarensis]
MRDDTQRFAFEFCYIPPDKKAKVIAIEDLRFEKMRKEYLNGRLK